MPMSSYLLAALLVVLVTAAPARATAEGSEPPPDPVVSVVAIAPQDPEAIIDTVAAMAPGLLAEYIRVDTTNPPGNETLAARFLAGVLEREGIGSSIFEPEPGRGSIYARIRGKGDARAIVLLSHTDVVPVDETHWKHPPMAGKTVDGVLYGRGALDAKSVGVVQFLAVVALKRAGIELSRDIILLATADEETGGRLGAGWMVEEHGELFEDVSFVLNEGGFILETEGAPLIYNVGAAEKGPCWFRVVATGPAGHGSRPAEGTAVVRLVEALGKLVAWERPLEVGPVVAGYFAAYAAIDEDHARQFRQLERSLEDESFGSWFMGQPAWAALVRDTLVPTVLVGSRKTNIVPAEATAEVDSRLLPGHSCEDFMAEAATLVAGEGVRVEPHGTAFPSSQSPLDSSLVDAIERSAAAEDGPAFVIPGMVAGFTDSHYFREKGIEAYGFVPIVISRQEANSLHAPDERVRVAELEQGVRRMVKLLIDLGS